MLQCLSDGRKLPAVMEESGRDFLVEIRQTSQGTVLIQTYQLDILHGKGDGENGS